MMSRNGRDLRYSLVEFTGSKEDAERLSGHILSSEGYVSIDPIHPLGGPDGTKDIKCKKEGKTFVAGCYFPRGQKSFTEIKKKFLNDLEGVKKNNANGFIFITNQEISDTERTVLIELKSHPIHIFHLERLIHILNTPTNYGVRYDFLDIEPSKADLASLLAKQTEQNNVLAKAYMQLLTNMTNMTNEPDNVLVNSLKELPEVLSSATSINRGDVYYADLGSIDSFEIMGRRPVIIVSNNINNRFSQTVTIVPISRNPHKEKLPTHVELGFIIDPKINTVVLADQIRTISKNRLRHHITCLNDSLMEQIDAAINIQLGSLRPYVRNEKGYIKIDFKE